MGVFKKLKGNDIRVTPIQVKYSKTNKGTVISSVNKNPDNAGEQAKRDDFYDSGNVGTDNGALVYNSIRQLFYGPFISQNFLNSGSIFTTPLGEDITTEKNGVFSRFDPSLQGSLPFEKRLPIDYNNNETSILSIDTTDFGETIVPGTFLMSGLIDDSEGNLIDGNGGIHANIFYDQGIIVRYDSSPAETTNAFSASYTIYSTQYKCTADAGEFNYSLNPTLLTGSSVEYDFNIVDSEEFMPYVTTIGLYNENQELMMVGKLSQPCQLNPYTDTNFIVRIDR